MLLCLRVHRTNKLCLVYTVVILHSLVYKRKSLLFPSVRELRTHMSQHLQVQSVLDAEERVENRETDRVRNRKLHLCWASNFVQLC